MLTCTHCGEQFSFTRKPGARGSLPSYCDDKCRNAAAWLRRKERGYQRPGGYPSREVACAGGCGSVVVRTRQSAAEPTCRQCRAKAPGRSRLSPCVDCADPSRGERCRPCANRAKVHARPRIRAESDHRVQRWQRDLAAPGLTANARSRLLARWKKQGRTCAYCPTLADTVDHTIPLVRGGTNYEGNLVPCCRSCNARKCALFISEWRHERKPKPLTEPLPWSIKPRRQRQIRWGAQAHLFPLADLGYQARAKPKTVKPCGECGVVFATHHGVYCQPRCAARAERRRIRSTERGRQRRREQKARARARRRDVRSTPGATPFTGSTQAA